jgi:hypothetical protein
VVFVQILQAKFAFREVQRMKQLNSTFPDPLASGFPDGSRCSVTFFFFFLNFQRSSLQLLELIPRREFAGTLIKQPQPFDIATPLGLIITYLLYRTVKGFENDWSRRQ